MSPGRILIVIWKWAASFRLKTIAVSDDSDAFLVCLPDSTPPHPLSPEQLQSELTHVYAEFKNKGKPFDFLVLLHETDHQHSADYIARIHAAIPSILQSEPILFSKGESFIYFRTDGNGLLDNNGGLAEDKVIKNTKTGKQGKFSVINGNGEILPDSFNGVWNFYTHRLKQHIFDLKEQFFIDFVAYPVSKGNTLPLSNLSGFEELGKRFSTIFSSEKSELVSQIYGENSPVKANYDALKNYLETTPINSENYLPTTATHFRNLLDAIPGEIY